VFTAVIVDREFRGLNYKNFERQLRHFLRNETQHHLANGELSAEFFTVTNVALETGKI
jgi:hypothetical protein